MHCTQGRGRHRQALSKQTSALSNRARHPLPTLLRPQVDQTPKVWGSIKDRMKHENIAPPKTNKVRLRRGESQCGGSWAEALRHSVEAL